MQVMMKIQNAAVLTEGREDALRTSLQARPNSA